MKLNLITSFTLVENHKISMNLCLTCLRLSNTLFSRIVKSSYLSVSFAIFHLFKRILPKTKISLIAAAGIAALISVPAAAAGFVVQYAIGATAPFSVSSVLAAMVGTHILIGIGESIITIFAVGAILSSRSDLVYGYRSQRSSLEVRTAE